MTAFLVPFYLACGLAAGAPKRHLRRAISALWFRGSCFLCGLRLKVRGTPHRGAPTVFAANHVSYLDIPVLGALLDVTFVAKKEVAQWPLIGFLAKLTGTVFVKRSSCAAAEQCRSLSRRLHDGHSVLFFPEGTSSDGGGVLPFRASLFEVAMGGEDGGALTVQPVSITYARTLQGEPLNAAAGEPYAWYGDMTLLPHLMSVFEREGVEVEVVFHPPVCGDAFASRKEIAAHCRRAVADGVARTHAW